MADGRRLTSAAVRLRPAVASDVRAIAEFQTACWREAYRGLVPQDYLDRVSVEDREVRWRERLVTGARRIAVAESSRAVVGVVSWGVSPDPRCTPALELMSLYVAASHRGTGVAAGLMTFAIGSAPAHLWVFEENGRARSFYAKQGFAPVGDRKLDLDTGVWEIRLARP